MQLTLPKHRRRGSERKTSRNGYGLEKDRMYGCQKEKQFMTLQIGDVNVSSNIWEGICATIFRR